MTVTGLEPRNDCNWTLYYIDTDTFIVYTKTEHIYGDIANITNSSNYELDHHLNQVQRFAALGAKTYIYLTDNNEGDKKPKGTKSVS